MTASAALLRAHGGIASVRELGLVPTQQRALARAASRGEILRLRRGVYAVADAHPERIRAATVGGRLTGVSALAHHGLWAPPRGGERRLHVEVRAGTTVRTGSAWWAGSVRVHWTRERADPQFGVAPLGAVLARCAAELPLPHAVAVLDSALRRTPLTPVELLLLSSGWRPAARAAVALVDERSESGTESVLRVLLGVAGIPSTPQAPLPIGELARADLLVGDRLLIECDSEAHHADPSNRRADLRRDEALMALGFIVFRLDYAQVFEDPEGVVAAVAAIVARGDHLSATLTQSR